MTNRRNDQYYNIEELIKDVEKLGDWRDPAQKEAFSEVYYKLQNTYCVCEINGKVTYYPIDIVNATQDVCLQKFPKPEGELEEQASFFYMDILYMAQKNHGIVPKHCGMPRPTEQKDYDELVNSCKKYLENQPQPF